jgi:CheY-like chemotaxis protein
VPYAGPASIVERPSQAITASQSYGLGNVRILVIDNDLSVLGAMRNLLDRWGCDARYAIGLDEVDGIASGGAFIPDIVLADYHLERGDCGLDAVARLRAATRPDLPAIVITADHTNELEETVRASNCELLRKPVKPAELRALMHHLLS